MSLLTITEAAHVAGVSRRTIQRSIQSGRLSATTTATGERAIDTAELLRVFGPLRQVPSDTPASMSQAVAPDVAPDATALMLVDVLREQLKQAHEEKARLLALLEAEQQARRDLEQKLLPPPPPQPEPPPHRHHQLWLLLAILALAIAALVWTRTSAYWPLGG
jgi:excisionase family DNA binding protein